MFYSHEILTNRQYGVATIWLVATIGSKSNTKKVTRKAIQEVDVQRACEKILEPGAPIALRLQGNLLYGVSRVYNQQCSYMLTDASKIQMQMNMFFKQFGANHVESDAGKARRENLIIEDDPAFIPMPIPDFNMDDFVMSKTSQHTNKTSSQMSPHTLMSGGSRSSEHFPVQLDLRHSSLSDRASPHGLQGLSSTQKPDAMDDGGNIFGQEEEIAGPGDWGMDIDEFGNIIEHGEPAIVQDEFDLPPLPSIEGGMGLGQDDQEPLVDDQGDFLMMDEQPLPDAEALPERGKQRGDQEEQHDPFAASAESQVQPAPSRRKRKAKIIQMDEDTVISRGGVREWQNNYHENCCTRKAHPVTAVQARQNALHLTFGLGINNIGQNLGVPNMVHPLLMQFSGDALFTALTGLEIEKESSRSGRKRLRSASESIEPSQEEEERCKQPRLEIDGAQQGRGEQDMAVDKSFDIDGPQSPPPEVGREAQSGLDDHPSSAMPWNRRSSLMPGSSIQGPGSARPQLGRDQPSSPLDKRSSVQDIHRYSDDMPVRFDDVGGGLHSGGSSFDGMPPPETPSQEKYSESQYTREALDREGQNFLQFIETEMVDNGERRHDEDYALQRKWLSFDDVFVPHSTARATAAQAFYHVLTLVTKGKLIVEQDGEQDEAFGEIHVGIKG